MNGKVCIAAVCMSASVSLELSRNNRIEAAFHPNKKTRGRYKREIKKR